MRYQIHTVPLDVSETLLDWAAPAAAQNYLGSNVSLLRRLALAEPQGEPRFPFSVPVTLCVPVLLHPSSKSRGKIRCMQGLPRNYAPKVQYTSTFICSNTELLLAC